MTTTRTPDCKCLDCGMLISAASTCEDERVPSPGDISICIHCGHIMIFNEDLTVRALTDAEVIEVAGNQEIILYQKALDEAKKKRKAKR